MSVQAALKPRVQHAHTHMLLSVMCPAVLKPRGTPRLPLSYALFTVRRRRLGSAIAAAFPTVLYSGHQYRFFRLPSSSAGGISLLQPLWAQQKPEWIDHSPRALWGKQAHWQYRELCRGRAGSDICPSTTNCPIYPYTTSFEVVRLSAVP